MFHPFSHKNWPGWRDVRPYICTLTIAFAFTNIWKVPRDGFRFGGASYGVLATLALILVGLPVAFLQLSIGQLSQQDPVGVWRAVPFFKGLGYLRLVISCLASTYTALYTSLSAAYFFYTFGDGIPFLECMYYDHSENLASLNGSECLEETYMAPLSLKPEYYIALTLNIIVLWIIFPFLLFSPDKFMKRILYLLGPVIIILMTTIFICLGDKSYLSNFQNEEWGHLLDPYIWHAAITQSLLSTHTAGGCLISLGDTVYHNVDVRRSAIALVAINIFSVWFSLLFWFSVNSAVHKYVSPVAVIIQTYETSRADTLKSTWPLLTFAMLFFSGVTTMLTLLFPLYDRFRRCGGVRWRLLSFTSSVVGALVTLAILLEGLAIVVSIEDVVVPFLISITTVTEVSAFVFGYGLKLVIEDIEFLTGDQLTKWWSYSMRAVAWIIVPVWVWWVVAMTAGSGGWSQPPWSKPALSGAAAVSCTVVLGVAALVVLRQYEFDIIAKLKSSFRPSREWGPRDPITHHYWLSRREGSQDSNSSRQSGQRGHLDDDASNVTKNSKQNQIRSNSDDWVYTIYRKKHIQDNATELVMKNRRSKSLDLCLLPTAFFAAHFRARDLRDDIAEKSCDSKT